MASNTSTTAPESDSSSEPDRSSTTSLGSAGADIMLDRCIRAKRLVDLHTHLLGMGDAAFWIDVVMRQFLVLEYEKGDKEGASSSSEEQAPRHAHKKAKTSFLSKACRGRLGFAIKQLKFPTMTISEAEKKLEQLCTDTRIPPEDCEENFTHDAVYSLSQLNLAFGYPAGDDATMMRNVDASTNRLLRNGTTGTGYFKNYIIFNARKREFEKLFGIKNFDVACLLGGSRAAQVRDAKVRAADAVPFSQVANLRRAFTDAFTMPTQQIGFTPNFYPRRFELKDAMYEGRLEVLSVLMNHVAINYDRSGVGYVEMSLGVNDVLNPDVWYYIISKSFASNSLEKVPPNRKCEPKPKVETNATPQLRGKKMTAAYATNSEAAVSDVTPTAKDQYFGFTKETGEKQFMQPKPRYQTFGVLAGFPRAIANDGGDDESARHNLKSFIYAAEDGSGLSVDEIELLPFLHDEWRSRGLDSEKSHALECLRRRLDAVRNPPTIGKMKELVKSQLSEDKRIEAMFGPALADKLTKLLNIARQEKPRTRPKPGSEKDIKASALAYYVHHFLVGLDAFGDEYGRPFTPLNHPLVFDVVKAMIDRGAKNFGVRVHALERVPEPSFVHDPRSGANVITAMHIVATHESLKHLLKNLPPREDSSLARVRLGHGTYLKCENAPSECIEEELKKMRALVGKAKVTVEVCPTSNHCLVADTGTGVNNVREMLQLLFKQRLKQSSEEHDVKIPFVFATDDDGILPIVSCPEHGRHLSVAHEYCVAICSEETGRYFLDGKLLEELTRNGQAAAFQCAKQPLEW